MLIAGLDLLAVVVLILANALFVAAEFALVAVEPHQLERAAAAGDRRAATVLRAVRSLSFQLSGAQLGITVTSLVVGYLAEPAIATLLEPALTAVGLPETPRQVLALGLALLVATVTQMVFGELVPKNWAVAEPVAVARRVAGAQVAFSSVCHPLIALLNGTANRLLRMLGVEPREDLRSARSAAELGSIVRSSAARGTLPTNTAALLGRTLRFGARTAADVMTPRVRTDFLTEDATIADLLTVADSSGHSRFPVLRSTGPAGPDEREDVDSVTGVVHVKDAFGVPPPLRSARHVSDVMVPPLVVPSSLGCDLLLTRLRRRGLQLAVVIDEYGGTDGIVTLEDLVEELVGHVADEYDQSVQPDVVPLGPDRWRLSGLLRIDEATDATGVRLPDGPYETVAGLVLARLGRLAEPGDTVTVAGSELTVLSVDAHRIDRIQLVTRAEDVAEDAPLGEGGR
jgi:CBS domain containing-hemolysin-like protein